MTRRAVLAFLVLVLAVGAGLAAGCDKEPMAKVGDTVITEGQFDQRMDDFVLAGLVPAEASDPATYAEMRPQVLEYMVVLEISKQKAPGLGVEIPDMSVTDEEIQAEIDSLVTSNYGGDEAQLEADLTSTYGITLNDYKAGYKAYAGYQKEAAFIKSVSEVVTKDITAVPEAEIAAYYEDFKADYFVDETRNVRHILIRPGTSATNDASTTTTTASATTTTSEWTDADWAAALATAEEVRSKLISTGDWTALAKEYSDDTGTADVGGDLGVVKKGKMVPEFNDAVFSLDLNEIPEPVKSTYGYHIIQVTVITAAVQQTLDEVRDDITSTLLDQNKEEAFEQWLEDVKTELGVTYREDMQVTTTTVSESTTTTVSADTTTSAGQTITTAATTTTTAKP